MKIVTIAVLVGLLCACWSTPNQLLPKSGACKAEFVVLGIGQDGGAPQIDNSNDPGWDDSSLRLWAASGALIDRESDRRYLFEATPDIREQLRALDAISSGGTDPLGLAGVFLSHAHIGHYAGLIFAGHESAGVQGLQVYTMDRMRNFLSQNGPWDQLVRYKNIHLKALRNHQPVKLGNQLSVVPIQVPHRDEYSETVGFVVNGPSKKLLFLPDIDDWDRWESEYGRRIETLLGEVDFALLDATFFDDKELPGRDMSRIPHPRVVDSIKRFASLSAEERRKVFFFHINHTNKLRYPGSEARRLVKDNGMNIAARGERLCLD